MSLVLQYLDCAPGTVKNPHNLLHDLELKNSLHLCVSAYEMAVIILCCCYWEVL